MGFPERLKALRLESNLTQKEIAEKFGIKQPNYQQWESGKRKPTSDTLEKFSEFFGVSTDYLLGNSDYRTVEEDELSEVEILFRSTSKGMTEEEKKVFKKEIINFMKEREKLFKN
ncbi:helix-turn-helix domain-containing protein [Streptococcus suis]|uniref:helix-turn-helix domain-containing protein n=1 Tax=Streptococcus parasuis TaxID=1501662 RepID=UPI00289C1EA2|nr:helix-turn-helix transcriptional regulator [Streptococcus parasuis]HEM3610516.1 helix-turn-helix transcriptional regulator [Streptococcus suis]HEM3711411.1 helix-turn-helix transcriptional regulator [Streptococcus suis]